MKKQYFIISILGCVFLGLLLIYISGDKPAKPPEETVPEKRLVEDIRRANVETDGLAESQQTVVLESKKQPISGHVREPKTKEPLLHFERIGGYSTVRTDAFETIDLAKTLKQHGQKFVSDSFVIHGYRIKGREVLPPPSMKKDFASLPIKKLVMEKEEQIIKEDQILELGIQLEMPVLVFSGKNTLHERLADIAGQSLPMRIAFPEKKPTPQLQIEPESLIINASDEPLKREPEEIPLQFWEKGEFTASLTFESALGTSGLDNQKTKLIFKPDYELPLSGQIQLQIAGRLRGNTTNKIEPRGASQEEISSFSKKYFVGNDFEYELRELFIDGNLKDIYFKFGKQQIVWGQADGIKILDQVNPQDFSEFILPEFSESRIPLWSANLEIAIHDTTVQLVWIPDPTYHNIPDSNALYAFVSPQLSPPVPTGVGVQIVPSDRPNSFFKDSDLGVRVSSFVYGWDFAAMYLYHYSDFPVLYQSLDVIGGDPVVTVSPKYERNQMMGVSFSNAFSDFTLRGEGAYFTNTYALADLTLASQGVLKSAEYNYLLGFDYQGVTDLFLSLQYSQSILNDSSMGRYRDRVENYLTFLAKYQFLNETLHAQVLFLQNLNRQDGLIRPKISYDFMDDILLWGESDIFYGDCSGLFGQYDANDRFVFGASYSW